MGLRLDDKWIWDFWINEHQGVFHLFHLQADRSLIDPERRHWNSSIGYATSSDLYNWDHHGTVLTPSKGDAWDNKTLWTGCTVEHACTWYLFYTSTQPWADNLSIQRVGVATSGDGQTWVKHDAPIVTADPRWYAVASETSDETWRDPWVLRYEDRWHMLVTASTPDGPHDERGVIAHAVSDDLINWEVLPPLDTPRDFGHMEVPQVVQFGDSWYLFFCVSAGEHSASRLARPGAAAIDGVHYLRGPSPLGPFERVTDEFLLGSFDNPLYAGRVVDGNLIAWKNKAADGSFIGEVGDPMPIQVDASGELSIED